MRADALNAGDRVHLRDRTWRVERAKVKRKRGVVDLVLADGADRFAREVPVDRMLPRVLTVQQTLTAMGAEAPRFTDTGAQGRWATPAEAAQPADVPDTIALAPATKAETRVQRILGGRFLGVEQLATGVYVVPPVDDTTVLAHLYTFHRTTFNGVPLSEARTRLAEVTETAEQAVRRADYTAALVLHARLHEAPETDQPVPHYHRTTTTGEAA